MTIIGGLILCYIGTYLGESANRESWGRAIGDGMQKKTRFSVNFCLFFLFFIWLIPGLQSKYAFNTATLFGFCFQYWWPIWE